MSTLKTDKLRVQNSSKKELHIRTQIHSLTKQPVIDYEKLSWLCQIKDSKSKTYGPAEQAHEVFMSEYKNVFVSKPNQKGYLKYIDTKSKSQNDSDSSLNTLAVNATTSSEIIAQRTISLGQHRAYNVKGYSTLKQTGKRKESPKQLQSESIHILRQILKKHPFERTAVENDIIYQNLSNFEFFQENVEPAVLKELSVLAQLETWPDKQFIVYGKMGIHMLLKGSVLPRTTPHLVAGVDGVYPSKFTFNEDCNQQLLAGDCFGTWLSYEDPYSEELSVVTNEENCEFLKFQVNDYKRIKEHIKHREETEKLDLLLHCEQYKLWPLQPLSSLAGSIEWLSYSPNTVLASEGYKSPFIGFIKSGECHVLREVEVFHTLKNGNKERRTKQVVIGKLLPHNSFAELSVLLDEPLTCSVITATKVQVGIIHPGKLFDLDDVTKQLLRQSNTRTFGHLTQEEIQTEYLQQELKRQWNEFKHAQIIDVINARGIRPGYGKWSKN